MIGGGSGSFSVLSGLRSVCHCHSIVTMMDSGGDSGTLRDAYGVLPPGDARRCLVALSEESEILRDLFSVRFEEEPLKGRNFGNLFILALRQSLGSDKAAFEAIGKILKIRGKVLPVTFDSVHLVAELADGATIRGEAAIDLRGKLQNSSTGREAFVQIEKVHLEPDASMNPEARDSIADADAIIVAPGDVYTSIVPNLLVNGISETIAQASAPLIVIVNIMTKHGETDGWTASRHVGEISKYTGRIPDAVLVNNAPIPEAYLEMYRSESAEPVSPDADALKELGVPLVLQEPVLAADSVVRHDPALTSKAVLRILDSLSVREQKRHPA